MVAGIGTLLSKLKMEVTDHKGRLNAVIMQLTDLSEERL
jgi:hypothetical protein